MTITIILITIIISLALTQDFNTTLDAVIAIIKIRGLTWLCEKVCDAINVEHGKIVGMAGWCIAGGFALTIITKAMLAVKPTMDSVNLSLEGWHKFGENMNQLGQQLDKLTFWN